MTFQLDFPSYPLPPLRSEEDLWSVDDIFG